MSGLLEQLDERLTLRESDVTPPCDSDNCEAKAAWWIEGILVRKWFIGRQVFEIAGFQCDDCWEKCRQFKQPGWQVAFTRIERIQS